MLNRLASCTDATDGNCGEHRAVLEKGAGQQLLGGIQFGLLSLRIGGKLNCLGFHVVEVSERNEDCSIQVEEKGKEVASLEWVEGSHNI